MTTLPLTPDVAPRSPASRRGPAGPGTGPAGPAGRRPRHPRPAGGRPDDRLLAMTSAFMTLFLEVEAGRRPRAQLRGVMTPMLYARLSDIWVRGGTVGRVVAVRTAARGARTCDLVAIVQRGPCWGAVSVGLVRVGRRWLVDAIARPEDGVLPPPPYPVPQEEPDDDEDELPPVARPDTPPASRDWFQPAKAR